VINLDFPAKSPGCPWGQGDNLGKNQGLVSARINQLIQSALPENTVLCSASFAFDGASIQPNPTGPSCQGECCQGQAGQGQCQPEDADCYCDQACAEFNDCCPDWEEFCDEDNWGGGAWGGGGDGDGGGSQPAFYYDDTLYFTINDVLIAASHGETLENLSGDDGLLFYDWNQIKGQPFGYDDASTYCLDACNMPDPNQYGSFNFSLEPTTIYQISLLSFLQNRFDFSMIIAGDNDENEDCAHGPLSLTVELEVTALN